MLGVIGLGYVGLPLAVALSEAGHRVVGVDADPRVIDSLRQGVSTVPDVSSERVREAGTRGMRLSTTSEPLTDCTTFIICVQTPLSTSGAPETGHIEAAVATIATALKPGDLVVLESTSYPGTTQEIVAEPLSRLTGLRAGRDFCVAFSPERVDPGNGTYRLTNTPKIVAGLHDCCREKAAAVYSTVTPTIVEASGVREAELAKLLENTYRQVNIALMNEMVKFCRALDIDLLEAIRCAATKPFGFQPFYPGPGVGGHCIPIDPKLLASRVESRLGYGFRFVELAQEINASMPGYVVDRLEAELALRGVALSGAEVLLLGVTYKRDVPDLRESPAEGVARELLNRGGSVQFLDPLVAQWEVDGQPIAAMDPGRRSPYTATVLLQDHSAFGNLDVEGLAPLCLDTRGALSGEFVVRL